MEALRDKSGRFLPGSGLGPGRLKGSPPRLISTLREALEEDDTLARLREVAIARLEAGDPSFWKLLLDRIWPAKLDADLRTETQVVVRWQDEIEPIPRRSISVSCPVRARFRQKRSGC